MRAITLGTEASTLARFEELVAEAASAQVDGWDFSWLNGRATEGRPSWAYARQLVERTARADALLDIQTGGGEVLAEVLSRVDAPLQLVAATEGWAPNVARARHNLAPYGVTVADVPDDRDLPFPANTFDLVVSRHPTLTIWPEIARVLQSEGTYFSQQVGVGSNRELPDFLMGPQPVRDGRSPRRAIAQAEAAGLEVVEMREETLRARFYDVGAVVYILRKVVWTVPGFTVDRFRDELIRLHEHIQAEGRFETSVPRFLIEARKPRSASHRADLPDPNIV
jgi:SAM-dependent methyltransferase